MLLVSLAVTMTLGGCGDESKTTQTVVPPQGPGGPGGPGGDPGGPGGSGGPGGPSGPPSKIKQVMGTLTKGPNSLTPLIGKELKEAEPPWDTIQPRAKDYARLTSELIKETPPKGSQESWTKLAATYAESASQLNLAAQAKDKTVALAAHGQITNSCKECHDSHRPGPPGGGPPGGGRRGGGPSVGPGSMPSGYPAAADLEKSK